VGKEKVGSGVIEVQAFSKIAEIVLAAAPQMP